MDLPFGHTSFSWEKSLSGGLPSGHTFFSWPQNQLEGLEEVAKAVERQGGILREQQDILTRQQVAVVKQQTHLQEITNSLQQIMARVSVVEDATIISPGIHGSLCLV